MDIQPYKISLDFYIRKIITVNAKQLDDKSRIINITCTENGKKFFIDSSTISAFVRYKKSDGYAVLNQVDILEDGTVNLVLTQQMLAVEGRHLVDIMLINKSELEVYTSSISVEDDDNGNVTVIEKQTANVSDLSVEEILNAISENGIKVLSTMSFYINTEGVTIDGSKIESSHEYSALIEGLGKMVAVDNKMSTLEQTIDKNEAERQQNETTRKSNENTRQTNETQRKQNETARQNNIQQAIQNCNQAANSANASASNANSAANSANTLIPQMQNLISSYNSSVKGVINDSLPSSTTTFSSQLINTLLNNKISKSSIVNSLTTTQNGYVLDASQGRILKEQIEVLQEKLSTIQNVFHGFEDPNTIDLENSKDGDVYMMIIEDVAVVKEG